MSFIDIFIYILASVGIFLTLFSIVEQKKFNLYSLNYNNIFLDDNKKVEVLVKISGLNYKESKIVIDKIKRGNYNDIYEIVTNLKVNINI